MDTKKAIVFAMIEEFSEKGYMASMSDLSKRVGIKVPSIYSHYKSKDEIILLCIKDEIKNFKIYYHTYLQDLKTRSTESILKDLFYAYIQYFKNVSKLRFWNNFDLIPNIELRKEGLNLYIEYMLELELEIKQIFSFGVSSGELRADLDKEAYLMYIILIQGVLRGMLKLEEISVNSTKYYEKVWQMYWKTIKIGE